MINNSLLLDSDVAIGLHELSCWNGVLKNYSVHVGSIAARIEVLYYTDHNQDKINIDLSSYIANGQITELEGSVESTAAIVEELRNPFPPLDGLDPGEMECVTITYDNMVENLTFCVIDHAAIKAMSYLGLADRIISVEDMLRDRGLLRKKEKIGFKYTTKRLRQFVTYGKILAISKGR